MGVNDAGLVATVMNREGTLGRTHGKRSRGELVLNILEFDKALDAALALKDTEAGSYRAFNLFFADTEDAYWARYRESAQSTRPEVLEVPEGLSMLPARELNDLSVARIAGHLPLFAAATAPDPETGLFTEWETLLGRRVAVPLHQHLATGIHEVVLNGADLAAGPYLCVLRSSGGFDSLLIAGIFEDGDDVFDVPPQVVYVDDKGDPITKELNIHFRNRALDPQHHGGPIEMIFRLSDEGGAKRIVQVTLSGEAFIKEPGQ